MKTITINLYTFDELSDEAKQTAIEKLSDINVSYAWWESLYEYAETIGLKITSFDLDRNRNVTGEFNLSPCEVAQNIFNNHGENCETYKTAENFMNDWQPVFNNYMDESHPDYESRESEEKLINFESEFLYSLCEDYSILLQHEYEYLCSREAIIETIQANDYYFTVNGKLDN